MHPIKIEEIESREFIPGFHGRMVHTERMTFVYWKIEAGAELPEHQHPQEQVTRMLSGQFQMTLGGKHIPLRLDLC